MAGGPGSAAIAALARGRLRLGIDDQHGGPHPGAADGEAGRRASSSCRPAARVEGLRPGEGRGRAGGDPRGGSKVADGFALLRAARAAASSGETERDGRARRRSADAPSSAPSRSFPADRRRQSERGAAARRARASARSAERRWSSFDMGRPGRRLLLGLHPHRTRPATPASGAARSTEPVLRAQRAALAAVGPAPSGREVDARRRTIIDDGGHGEHFGHGLGSRRRRWRSTRPAAVESVRGRRWQAGARRHGRAGRLPARRARACGSRTSSSWTTAASGLQTLAKDLVAIA